MKRQVSSILVFTLLFCFSGLSAQNSFNDIIYLLDSNDTIKDCRILNINHNKVNFDIVNGKKSKVISMGVVIKGYYIELPSSLNFKTDIPVEHEADSKQLLSFDYHQYLFHQNKYLNARKVQKSTLVLSIIGLASIGVGEYFLADYEKHPIDFDPRLLFGSILKYGGIGTAAVGIPLFVLSTISKKKHKKKLQLFDKSNISVGMKLHNNGLGIAVSF